MTSFLCHFLSLFCHFFSQAPYPFRLPTHQKSDHRPLTHRPTDPPTHRPSTHRYTELIIIFERLDDRKILIAQLWRTQTQLGKHNYTSLYYL